MKQSTIGIAGSVVFLIAILGGFFYIWNSANVSSGAATSSDSSGYSVPDISGMKDDALRLTQEAENNAGLPIPVPSSKLGKANPFTTP